MKQMQDVNFAMSAFAPLATNGRTCIDHGRQFPPLDQFLNAFRVK